MEASHWVSKSPGVEESQSEVPQVAGQPWPSVLPVLRSLLLASPPHSIFSHSLPIERDSVYQIASSEADDMISLAII